MIDIVVFGKPRSFESYEFCFDGEGTHTPENTHSEPRVKPADFANPVFHFFRKDGIACWEIYRRCKGFDSDRPGIIFGVGIKSDKDFDLVDTLGGLMVPLWEDFASAFIDKNYKFKLESIVNPLKTTKWSAEEEEKVRHNFSDENLKPATQDKELLLLAVSEFDDLKKIEKSIKEYNDVYIASSATLFQELINRDALKKYAGNEIHVVKDGKIEKLQKPKEKSGGEKDDNKKSGWKWFWGGGDDTDSDDKGKGKGGRKLKPLPKLIAAVALIALIIAVLCFVFKPKPADTIKLATPDSGYVTDDFDLQPKLFHGESGRTSTKLKDIRWEIEGDGSEYVDIVDGKVFIKSQYYSYKPRKDLSFSIEAFRNDNRYLGGATYKLEKYCPPKANKVILASYNKPIEQWLDLNPTLYYNENPDVSTQLTEITFKVDKEDIAKCEYNNRNNKHILKVVDRPEKDTEVTVTAYIDVQKIGEQPYTIAKKEQIIRHDDTGPSTGYIFCNDRIDDAMGGPYQNLASSYTSESFSELRLIATSDNQSIFQKKYSSGNWIIICNQQIQKTFTQNPMSCAEINLNSGTYIIQFVQSNSVVASKKITIN